MADRCKLRGTLTPVLTLSGTLTPAKTIKGELSIPNEWSSSHYDGPYEVEPDPDVEIVLDTSNQKLVDNIVIKPIPKDYAHFTWDGRIITFS